MLYGGKNFPQLEIDEVFSSKPSNLVDALELEEDPLLNSSFRTTLDGCLQSNEVGKGFTFSGI